ncbi:radical SAM protein [Bradyrhizobium sp. UFLA05-153]
METNRGCPYSCTFCDWGSATQSKVRQFDLARVKEEITWIARRGIGGFGVADANFGILARDEEIAEHIVRCKAAHAAPRQFFVNYAKNATDRVACIVEKLAGAGLVTHGILGIQTTDPKTLEAIARSNIKTANYDALAKRFQGMELPLHVDLMIGLPGATLNSFAADLQHFFDRKVCAKAFLTRVLPNSPMAAPEYRRRHGIVTDALGFVESCHSFDRAERDQMIALYRIYRSFLGPYGLLKYVARYLQWDHGIPALTLFSGLIASEARERWPMLAWAVDALGGHRKSPGGWGRLFGEFAAYLAIAAPQISHDSAFTTAMTAQEAVLPDEGRHFPETVDLSHDIVAWHRDRLGGGEARLTEYAPATLTVVDPFNVSIGDPQRVLTNDGHLTGEWELPSPLSARRITRYSRLSTEAIVTQDVDLAMY